MLADSFLHEPEVWVAILTGVLALATFALAVTTRNMSQVARREIAVQVKPIVVASGSPTPTSHPNYIGVDVNIENAGKGPALLTVGKASSNARTRDKWMVAETELRHTLIREVAPFVGQVSVRVRVDLAKVMFKAATLDSDWLESRLTEIELKLEYTDLAGQQPTQTVLLIQRDQSGHWYVAEERISDLRRGEWTQIASLRPRL